MALDRDGPEEHRCLVARHRVRSSVSPTSRCSVGRTHTSLVSTSGACPSTAGEAWARVLVEAAERMARASRRVPSWVAWTRRPNAARATWTLPGRSPVASGSPSRSAWCGGDCACRCDPSTPTRSASTPRPHPIGLLAGHVRRPVARSVPGRSLRARPPHVDRRAGRRAGARRGGVGRGTRAGDRSGNGGTASCQGHDGGPRRRSGRLVGFTEVVVPLGAPESAWQHDTLVDA